MPQRDDFDDDDRPRRRPRDDDDYDRPRRRDEDDDDDRLPPRRKSNTGLVVGILVGVFVLCCGGGGTAIYFILRGVKKGGRASHGRGPGGRRDGPVAAELAADRDGRPAVRKRPGRLPQQLVQAQPGQQPARC